MTVEHRDVVKIAHLARLAIPEEKLNSYTNELAGILDFIAQINTVATDEILPLSHPLEMTQRVRADQITEVNQRELFQSIAPLVEVGLYLVPQVIE